MGNEVTARSDLLSAYAGSNKSDCDSVGSSKIGNNQVRLLMIN